MSSRVKLAVIGVGMMGKAHLRDAASLDNCEVVAICDINSAAADHFAAEHNAAAYYDYRDLLRHEPLDAVLVVTPHYDHTPISIAALDRGIHVLVEKPIAVHVKDAHRMIAAYDQASRQYPSLVFASMFMQRTYGYWRAIKTMIDEGQLGRLVRVTWIVTDWFRTQNYYDSGGWRATWKYDGGGVLLNQCPHNLDMYQWLVGMPERVTGFVSLGKYHTLEVEDEVTAYFEHENGTVGHFITSTGESPGTNRLEIVGEHGRLIYEDQGLIFYRNQVSMLEHLRTAAGGFDKAPFERVEISYEHHGQPGHRFVIENFANAILKGEPLIAPAREGLHSLELGNAIMMSSFEGRPVDLPLDGEAYEQKLLSLIESSTFTKPVPTAPLRDDDLGKSF